MPRSAQITTAKLLNYFKHQADLSTVRMTTTEKYKNAAILIPIIEDPEQLKVLFTLRTEHLFDHPGQICFPGGRAQKQDRNLAETALRETFEETGLPSPSIQLIGNLEPINTRTGFVVTPFVSLLSPPFRLKMNHFEVAEIFELPLNEVLDASNHQQKHYMQEGETRSFYAIEYQRRYIWGVTAAILLALAKVLDHNEM